MPAAAGHHERVSYLWEESGGSPAFATTSSDDTTNKAFGSDARLTTREGSNQAVRVFNPNDREAREAIEQMFSGSWSVEFNLTNPWWLKAVIAAPTTSGSDPSTHTFDGKTPYPMRIIEGNEQTGNEYALRGCVAGSASISVNVNGLVTVTIDGAYADEEQIVSNDTTSLTAQPTLDYRPLHFGHASVSRGGSVLGLIQSVSVSIENNVDIIGELGTRVGVDYSPKKRIVDTEVGDIVEDDSEVKRMYGDSAASSPQTTVDNEAAITVVFDNGQTGAAKNSVTLNLTGNFPDSYSRSGVGNPEADLEGAINEITPSIDATAENDTASAL